jgi:hypothetical protein
MQFALQARRTKQERRLSQSLRRDGTEMAKLRLKAREGCSVRFRAEQYQLRCWDRDMNLRSKLEWNRERRMGFVNAMYLLPPRKNRPVHREPSSIGQMRRKHD